MTAFSLHGGGGYSKQLDLRGDGTAWVSKKHNGEVGVDFGIGISTVSGLEGLGADVQGNLTGSYANNYRYNNWQDAEAFYHDGSKAHAADSHTFDVGLQGNANISFGPASAEGGGSLGGKYTVFDNHQYYGNLGSEYTGYESGNAKLGVDLGLANGNGSVSGTLAYTVIYDRSGNPVRLVVAGDEQFKGAGGMGFGTNGKAGSEAGGGEKWDHNWFLDLRNPLNREAFDNAFHRAGWFATPNNNVRAMSELANRMKLDGIETESKYTTGQDGAELDGRPNNAGKWGGTVGAGLTFGLEGQNSSGTSQLADDNTMVMDHHDGTSASWRPLSDYGLCGKQKYFEYCQKQYGTCPTDTPSRPTTNTITIADQGDQDGEVGMYTEFAVGGIGALDSDESQNANISYSSTGLPDGLTLYQNGGSIIGYPTTPGDYNVTITASDSTGAKATVSFHWRIRA
nr:Ig domain-containing protein [Streptomyces sp. TLI_235]